MSRTRPTPTLVRLLLVTSAGAVALSWLWALFFFPEVWRDHHGYNQLVALILTSALHWAVVVPLAVAYQVDILGPWLPRLLFAAPLAHITGSTTDGLWCLPFFVAPSVATLVVGALEVRSARSDSGSSPSGPNAAPDAACMEDLRGSPVIRSRGREIG